MSSTINASSISSFTIDPSFWANAPAGQPNEQAPGTGTDTLPPDGSPPPRTQYSPASANILAQLQKQSGGAQPRQGQGALAGGDGGAAWEARRYGNTSVVTGSDNYFGDTQPQPAPGASDRTQATVKRYSDGSFTREHNGQVTFFKKVPGGYNVYKPDGSVTFTVSPHDKWLSEALERHTKLGKLLKADQDQQAAEQAAREQRRGLGGAVRAINKELSNLAKTPENLYRSVRDQGLAKTIDNAAVSYLTSLAAPFKLANALSEGDMQTAVSEGFAILGAAKIPGGRTAGKLERTAAGAGALERKAGTLERVGAKGEMGAAEEAARLASKPLQIDNRKFDYLFGRVTSGQHNTARSQQLQSELSQIGIYDTANGRATLTKHFSEVAANPSSIVRTYSETRNGVTQNFSVRESLLAGPGGFTRLETTFETIADGTNRFITTIPIPVPNK